MTSEPLVPDRWLGSKLAAHWLDVDISTLKRWRKNRCGPPYTKKGGRIEYWTGDLREWRLRGRQAA